MTWTPSVAVDVWCPDSSLAALRQLESLYAGSKLQVSTQDHWQQVAHLSVLCRLAAVKFMVAPQQWAGATLALLDMSDCTSTLDGDGLGLLLSACPMLQRASFFVAEPVESIIQPPAQQPLPQHPSLQQVELDYVATCASAAHFSAVKGVLRGVACLEVKWWRLSSAGPPAVGLPDLAAFTALTHLRFGLAWGSGYNQTARVLLQEDILLMLAPVVQLRPLAVSDVPVNARIVGWLQGMMPQLQRVELAGGCRRLVPAAAGSCSDSVPAWLRQQQAEADEAEALAKVRRLLRPGLVLKVPTWMALS